jgi:ketosteroid isomerase-like protein
MADTEIKDDRARRFADGLHRLDAEGDAAGLAALFADDALTQRFDARGERRGEVEAFWKEYRDQFQDISTRFYNAVEGEDEFALEWTSEATLAKGGRPLTYRGVTAFGYEGDTITWLRTYYDSAQFAVSPAGTGS